MFETGNLELRHRLKGLDLERKQSKLGAAGSLSCIYQTHPERFAWQASKICGQSDSFWLAENANGTAQCRAA